jgi:hypothetical protein
MTFALRVASLILPSLLVLELPARADDVQVGTAPIWDTQQQVERFVALYDGHDPETAVSTVNAEVHDPNACVVVTMLYVPEPPLVTVRKCNATFQIVPVLVVGVVTPQGIQAIDPVRFFSVMEVDELDI